PRSTAVSLRWWKYPPALYAKATGRRSRNKFWQVPEGMAAVTYPDGLVATIMRQRHPTPAWRAPKQAAVAMDSQRRHPGLALAPDSGDAYDLEPWIVIIR